MDVQTGQVIAQRYRLVRELGRGGVGSVWLAHQLALDAPCAIKFFIGPDADLEQYRQRFDLEAKAAARLQHPNVVRVLDSGIFDGRPYIAMEYLDGECLDERLRRRGRLVPSETVAFCNQVGQALAAAHAVGIVHRDLKPGNIFLAREQGRIVVKLIDFGIAKASTFAAPPTALTHHETIIGTPAYMSPEQIEATHTLDGRSDLWSLGVIVFECLTGQIPFDSTTIGELFSKIMFKPLPVPSQVAHGLPPALDAWWLRASAREVDKRFQSAGELCEGLTRALMPASAPEGDPTWWAATGGSMPTVTGSFQPTLSGQARPHMPAYPTRGGLLLAAAVLLGSLVLIASIVMLAWMRHVPAPPSGAALDVPSGAPSLATSAASTVLSPPPALSPPPRPPSSHAAGLRCLRRRARGERRGDAACSHVQRAPCAGPLLPLQTEDHGAAACCNMGFLSRDLTSRSAIAAALLVATALVSRPAEAQSEADRLKARELGDQGKAALAKQDYTTAASLFRKAFTLVTAPTLEIGLARAEVGLGHWVSARRIYEHLAAKPPEPSAPPAFARAMKDATAEFAQLELRMPAVIISLQGPTAGSAEVTIDGEPLPAKEIGQKHFVDPGQHVARAAAPEYRSADTTFTASEGAVDEVRLVLLPKRQKAAFGFALIGLGAGALAFGGVAGVLAMTHRSALLALCSNGQCSEAERGKLESYHRDTSLAWPALGVGVAGVGVGTALLLTSDRSGAVLPRKLGPALVGAGISGISLGAVAGILTLTSKRDSASCTGATCQDRIDGAHELGAVSLGSLAAGGAAALSGALLIALNKDQPLALTVTPRVGPGMVGLSGRF